MAAIIEGFYCTIHVQYYWQELPQSFIGEMITAGKNQTLELWQLSLPSTTSSTHNHAPSTRVTDPHTPPIPHHPTTPTSLTATDCCIVVSGWKGVVWGRVVMVWGGGGECLGNPLKCWVSDEGTAREVEVLQLPKLMASRQKPAITMHFSSWRPIPYYSILITTYS